jgi:hypothetical protein
MKSLYVKNWKLKCTYASIYYKFSVNYSILYELSIYWKNVMVRYLRMCDSEDSYVSDVPKLMKKLLSTSNTEDIYDILRCLLEWVEPGISPICWYW